MYKIAYIYFMHTDSKCDLLCWTNKNNMALDVVQALLVC